MDNNDNSRVEERGEVPNDVYFVNDIGLKCQCQANGRERRHGAAQEAQRVVSGLVEPQDLVQRDQEAGR